MLSLPVIACVVAPSDCLCSAHTDLINIVLCSRNIFTNILSKKPLSPKISIRLTHLVFQVKIILCLRPGAYFPFSFFFFFLRLGGGGGVYLKLNG